MTFKTADLLDDNEDKAVQVVQPGFLAFGGKTRFSGRISTIKAHEDNSLVREAVASDGNGQVLVIDGGGSTRCAMLGDLLAAKAVSNGWQGVVVYGLIRDSADINTMDLGVRALGTIPLKSIKRGEGRRDLAVHFHDADLYPGITCMRMRMA
ncbi:MAG: ribonuclease E activity regulator RraA [Thiolinea sp.]